MCGIAGLIGFRDDAHVREMSRLMEHRGPNGEGFYFSDGVSLLNRRLAIIDVAGGDQPIYNEDKTIAVVYNGEIYNYQELRAELEKKGHTFRTKSDTEVIVHGYEEWGTACFDMCNGMFAIALYDMKKHRVILARDHFGIKPLYYCQPRPGHFIFASEIKALLAYKGFRTMPNERVIYRYLVNRIHDEGVDTFFVGIRRLLPGQMLSIEEGAAVVSHFTTLRNDILKGKTKPCEEKDIRQFGDLLTDAVKSRLVSEVPVGTCLSGGLDSSTIVALVNRLLKEKSSDAKAVGDTQRTFSAVFPGSGNDEERYIDELLGQSSHIRSFKIKPKSGEFMDDLMDFVRTQEEPTISTGPYAQYQVMREAHKHVTVLLDGQGSDEMMAGYLPYYFVYLRQLWKQGRFATLAGEIVSSLDVLWKFGIMTVRQRLGSGKPVPMKQILNKEFATAFRGERFTTVGDDLKERLAEDIFGNSLQSLLRYEDKNSMRFSVEGRVPFLDIRLLRFVFSLSDDAIIREGWNKYILRRATEGLLPREINKRRNKIGFTTPEHEWFLREHKRIEGFLTGEMFLARKYINQREAVMAFKGFATGIYTDTMAFWRIVNLELWLRTYFPEQKEKQPATEPKAVPALEVDGVHYHRLPIKTLVFKKGEPVAKKIAEEVVAVLPRVLKSGKRKWFVVVSEKIVAITQGRSYFIWDIRPGLFARVLSRFVKRTPAGIGLGSPWTMELAIGEVGLPRILFAALASVATKPFGVAGVFYRVAGPAASAIDGPTEYSLFPSNVSAKLAPKHPGKVALEIGKTLMTASKKASAGTDFMGAAIIDANDIGQHVMGNATGLDDATIEAIFEDNPMGQTNEQTPVTLVYFN